MEKNLKRIDKNKNSGIEIKLTSLCGTALSTENKELEFITDLKGLETNVINIYNDIEYQEIEGFGGAFTESASTTLDKMSPDKRSEAITAYFDPEKGIGYQLCRTHINSCDFSLGNYAYDETYGDMELRDFSIDRDRKSLIPLIKDAQRAAEGKIRIFASPWSPPAWMKTNGMMNQGGKLKSEFYDVWARYFVKYISEYASEGIKIWGLTVQNEPKAVQRWDSCIYSAEEERDFVKLHLGPELRKAGMGNVKIMFWDHNKERLYERARTIYEDKGAAQYIWGSAFHWYSGDHFEAISAPHDRWPEKKLLFTEGCLEHFNRTGSIDSGERYAHDIIGNLNGGACGFVDWNIVLDEQGGPNHVGNFCAAPIIADTRNNKLIYETSYYYIGHFSKYIVPGSHRIGMSRFSDALEVTAFKRPDEKIVVVVMNQKDRDVKFLLRDGDNIAEVESPSHSIQTILY